MPRTTARIGRHPLHPMLVLFPIGFWISALLCDVLYWQTSEAGFAVAAVWLVGAGLIGAVRRRSQVLPTFSAMRTSAIFPTPGNT